MYRITYKDLQYALDNAKAAARHAGIDRVHGYPIQDMQLDGAYGGYAVRIGGCDLTQFGHQPKRVVYTWLRGFTTALEDK